MAAIKFLITGATSGLGGSVLSTIYQSVAAEDHASIAAASSRADAAEELQRDFPGIQFRVFDFSNKSQILEALKGVQRFFFVSSPEFDIPQREKQHQNVVEAAKEAGVSHVYYSSLAFGGYDSNSKAGVQQAHLATERLLQESGLEYTSIRMGLYTDAFPFFVNWYPDTQKIYVSGDGAMALTSRKELGEATAKLMLRDPKTLQFRNNIALLTASRTYTLRDIVDAISKATGQEIMVEQVPREDLPAMLAAEDAKDSRGKKSAQFFAAWLGAVDAIQQGETTRVDPLMAELLGREPRNAMQHVMQLVRDGAKEGGYTWHQNYHKQ